MSRTERVLDRLVDAVPAAIAAAGLQPNACILAGRLAVEALRAQGVRARPVPVMLQVANRSYERLVTRAGGVGNVTQADVDGCEVGPWCVMLGYGSPAAGSSEGWDGHLVVIADGRYLLDLTAGQLARLKKGIHAKPYWVEAPELAHGKHVALRAEDGCLWLYEPTGDRSFLSKPAWSGYRVSVRAGCVMSERSGPAAENCAPTVKVVLA